MEIRLQRIVRQAYKMTELIKFKNVATYIFVY